MTLIMLGVCLMAMTNVRFMSPLIWLGYDHLLCWHINNILFNIIVSVSMCEWAYINVHVCVSVCQ